MMNPDHEAGGDAAMANTIGPKRVEVTVCPPGVADGLRKSKYIKPTARGFANREPAEPIKTGDRKFDMYVNALPRAIRQIVVDKGLDVRALYKEYRAIGKDAMVEKYGEE